MAINGRFGKSVARKDSACFCCDVLMPLGTSIFFDNHLKHYVCLSCMQGTVSSKTEPSPRETSKVQPAPRNSELEALKARVASLESQVARLSEYARKSTVDGKLEAKQRDIFDGFV